VRAAFIIENVTVVASPTDFGLTVTHIEKSSTAVRGLNVSGALIVNGQPGATMIVRVLANP
jgi:hypothetical protein